MLAPPPPWDHCMLHRRKPTVDFVYYLLIITRRNQPWVSDDRCVYFCMFYTVHCDVRQHIRAAPVFFKLTNYN